MKTKSSHATGTTHAAGAVVQPVPRQCHNMDEVAEALGCSTPTVYRLISAGYLQTFTVGRRRYASPRQERACVRRLEEIGSVLPFESGGNNRPVHASLDAAPPAEAT
jgi:excisionase family DNA binding protein